MSGTIETAMMAKLFALLLALLSSQPAEAEHQLDDSEACVSHARVVAGLIELAGPGAASSDLAVSLVFEQHGQRSWSMTAAIRGGAPVQTVFEGSCREITQAMAAHLAVLVGSDRAASTKAVRPAPRRRRATHVPSLPGHDATLVDVEPEQGSEETIEPTAVADDGRGDEDIESQAPLTVTVTARPRERVPRARSWAPVVAFAAGYGSIPGYWRQPHGNAVELRPELGVTHKTTTSLSILLRASQSPTAAARSTIVELVGCQRRALPRIEWALCSAAGWGWVRMPYPHASGVDTQTVWLVSPSLTVGLPVGKETTVFGLAELTIDSSRRLAGALPIGTGLVVGARHRFGCRGDRRCK